MKFSQMRYERPDAEQLRKQLSDLTTALAKAADYETARDIFLKKDKLSRHLDTMATLAQIRHSIDTRDAFYEAECDYFNMTIPELQEYEQAWTKALLDSPHRARFEEEFGSVMFLNAQIELRSFSPAIIPEMQQENDLTQAYEKLLASAAIPFEGKTYTIAQIAPFKSCEDDATRLAAWKAEGTWYKEHQSDLDDLYDRLVKLRTAMGQKLGYDNYVPLGYDRMGRNCYTKSDVEAFRSAVVKYLVPVADSIYRTQAKRLGKTYPMSFADNALTFRSGNAKPIGSAQEILASGKAFYDALSPETSQFFREMLDGELLDVLSTEGKQGGGYCTAIYDYRMPFIFANFNGTRDDVETVTHEAGHAFAAWMNIDRVPVSTVWPPMESCEVHSMSMEFFAWPWAESFFGEDTRKFKYAHLAGALTFIPYGTMVDHFQHLIYENPDWTPRQRHDAWKQLLSVYMPWQKLDGEIPFYSDGEGWQRQHHIYSYPFYYIDYCLAQTVALEFWAMMQDDFENAWLHYMTYTKQGGSKTFTDLLKTAELKSPFDEDCLRAVCDRAAAWLADFDLSGIE